MKRFEFDNTKEQLYYAIKSSSLNTSYIVYILLKKSKLIYYDNILQGKKQIVFTMPIDFDVNKKELVEKLQEFLTTHKDLLINFGVTFVAAFLAIWIFSLTTNIRFEPRRPEFQMPPPPPPPMSRNFNPGPPPPPPMPPRP